MSRRPLKLKGWEFVKDKRHNLSTLTYSPSCATIDFDNLPEI